MNKGHYQLREFTISGVGINSNMQNDNYNVIEMGIFNGSDSIITIMWKNSLEMVELWWYLQFTIQSGTEITAVAVVVLK